MTFRRSGTLAWVLFCAAALGVSGCHKNNNVVPAADISPSPGASVSAGPSTSPSPSPSPSLAPGTATTSFTLVPGGGSVTLSTNGVAGTLVYPASTAGASASGAFTLTTVAPAIPSPAPTGTSSIFFQLQFSTTIAFQSGFVVSPVTLPLSVTTTGVTWLETIYDSTTGATIGSAATGSVSGQTVSFAAVGGPFSATAGDIYLIVISTY
ncbi:MAG: hypothetical protein ACLPYS_04550 [Vulcanimicrobiaceae bacterium]